MAVAALGGVVALSTACGSHLAEAGVKRVQTAPPLRVAAQRTPALKHAHLYLTIVTGGMNGKKDWPEYIPGNFTVPAGAIVDVQIRNFDNGPATIPAGYNRVVGTIGGTMRVIKAVNGAVDRKPATTVSAVAASDVAHTFTIKGSGFSLNVPVPPLSTVEFSFRSPAAGRYRWQCYASCGSQGGWGGPMATEGWMRGMMTVA